MVCIYEKAIRFFIFFFFLNNNKKVVQKIKEKLGLKHDDHEQDFYFIVLSVGDVLCGSQPEGVTHLGILQQWFGIHWWNSREFALLVTVGFILLPLVLLRRIGQ